MSLDTDPYFSTWKSNYSHDAFWILTVVSTLALFNISVKTLFLSYKYFVDFLSISTIRLINNQRTHDPIILTHGTYV